MGSKKGSCRGSHGYGHHYKLNIYIYIHTYHIKLNQWFACFLAPILEQTSQKPFRWDRKNTENTHHYKSWDQFFQGIFLMIFQLWLSVCRLGSLYTPVGIFWDLPKKMTPNATFSFPVFFSSQFSRLSCLTEDVNYRNHCSFVPFLFFFFAGVEPWMFEIYLVSSERGLFFKMKGTPRVARGSRIPSPILTWKSKMMVSKRNLLFQGAIFRFHVKLGECNAYSPWN